MIKLTDEQIHTLKFLIEGWINTNKIEFDVINFCPKCGSKVMYYHGTGYTEIICTNKCDGMTALKTIER